MERDAVIHYLSTERDVVVGTPASTSRGSLLAVGNPAFDDGGPLSRAQPATMALGVRAGGPGAIRQSAGIAR